MGRPRLQSGSKVALGEVIAAWKWARYGRSEGWTRREKVDESKAATCPSQSAKLCREGRSW
jgi:hypothetical protein